MTDARDISIRAQSAAHDAATVYAALTPEGVAFDVDLFSTIHSQVYSYLSEFIDGEQQANAMGELERQLGAQAVEQPAFPPIPSPEPGPFETPGMFPPPAAPPYAPQAPVAGYQPPMVPGGTYAPPAPTQAQYPPPPVPQAPPMQGMPCPKCGGPTYDNRGDNQRKRMSNFKLGPDFKCKNQACGGTTWPADFQAYKHLPAEPRR